MKPVQKFCVACIVGLLAASDDAAALEDVGTLGAATTEVPPMYGLGCPEVTCDRTLPKDDPAGIATRTVCGIPDETERRRNHVEC